MRGPAKLASYVAVGMVLVGFLLIYLSWDGASDLDRLQSQFPYLLSGGLVGIAFIGAGVALFGVQELRQQGAEERARMGVLVEELSAVSAAVRERGVEVAVRQAVPSGVGAREPDDEVWAAQDEVVVVGRSSYHDPSCHLVAARDDLDLMGRTQAEDLGLSPCRICKP